MRAIIRTLAVLLGLLGLAAVDAAAQPTPAQPAPDERKARAERVYFEGNELYIAGKYADAVVKYKDALALYDHPDIRLQMATTLGLDLAKPVAAHPHLVVVMSQLERLDPDQQRKARRLYNVLRGQLGFVRILCKTEAVRVTLDGGGIHCGDARQVVKVGRHQIVGERDGYLARAQEVFVEPSEEVVVDIQLVALADQRRWAVWKPWAVVAGGAAVLAIGVPLQLAAKNNLDAFQARVSQECGTMPCVPTVSTGAVEDRALRQNRAAVALLATGGLVVSAGVVLAYMNRERAMLVDEPQLSVGALAAPDAGGLILVGRF